MSALGERTLMLHLTDRASLEVLAREGLPEECVPTPALRTIYLWAMEYFHRGGRIKPPSVALLRAEWADVLDDEEIDIEEDPEDTIEWVIDDLKGSYIWVSAAKFNKDFANALAEVDTLGKIEVANEYATKLIRMTIDMESHEFRVDAREGLVERLQAYEERVQDRDEYRGMRFGLQDVDRYTRGIHPGELAVLAAGPKVGKSYFMCMVALREWEAGRVCTFFTLENDVEMTLDRIACLATVTNSREFQAGTLPEQAYQNVRTWIERVKDSPTPLHIIQPGIGERSVESLVRQAQLNGSDSILIDQLSYLEVENERQPRHLQIRELTHTLKGLISTGRHRMPCLIAHQISREGVKAADKVGYLEMHHLAEGSETERTADWVFGVHRSLMEMGLMQAKLQTLAARREAPEHFKLTWDVGRGNVRVIGPTIIQMDN